MRFYQEISGKFCVLSRETGKPSLLLGFPVFRLQQKSHKKQKFNNQTIRFGENIPKNILKDQKLKPNALDVQKSVKTRYLSKYNLKLIP
eukprot:snap_masked-scaffold_6-processed-gene-5.30-mRNA-1 protein AED:1.00 eAED:1.00 QI:0/0/0/0/1/1/2/0/88